MGTCLPCPGMTLAYMHPAKALARACEEKARLLRRYAVAESNHHRALEILAQCIDTLQEPNPEVLHDFADTARQIVNDAREALERHIGEHGC